LLQTTNFRDDTLENPCLSAMINQRICIVAPWYSPFPIKHRSTSFLIVAPHSVRNTQTKRNCNNEVCHATCVITIVLP
jgi:hypothetical protein